MHITKAQGNIGEMKWKVTAHDVKYYLNDYDPLNCLLGSSYGVEREVQSGTALPFVERIGTQEYDEFGISYDAIGNIVSLITKSVPANCMKSVSRLSPADVATSRYYFSGIRYTFFSMGIAQAASRSGTKGSREGNTFLFTSSTNTLTGRVPVFC